ncbi:MAG: YciI family protein [Pseudomonadales bacterium]
MQFVMICEDKPDSLELRLANRENHLAYIGTRSDGIRLAGPMLSDDGEGMVGSLFIIEADSIEDVRDMNANDPYTRAGLFANVTIRPFRQVVPAP